MMDQFSAIGRRVACGLYRKRRGDSLWNAWSELPLVRSLKTASLSSGFLARKRISSNCSGTPEKDHD
jgi:hypothetical protein